MQKNKKKIYLPHERGYLEQSPNTIKSYSPSGKDFTKLPNPSEDPIVSNNIANSEFDYTSKEDQK